MFDAAKIMTHYFPKWTGIPVVESLFKRLLDWVFKSQECQQFIQRNVGVSPFEFSKAALKYFNFSYMVSEVDRAKIPKVGRVIIYANHPIGTLDGLLLLDLIASVRDDVKVVSNEVLEQITVLSSVLLPVNNLAGGTAKKQLAAIESFLYDEGALIVFPSGEVSRMTDKGIRDRRWHSGFLHFAKKTYSPLLPVYINAQNSRFFYLLARLFETGSTLWLVREMFKHRNNCINVHVGEAISPDIVRQQNINKELANQYLNKLYDKEGGHDIKAGTEHSRRK